jgi:hypothetical protein
MTVSRRRFLKFLPALAPIAIAQVYPPEPETEAITIDSLNKRLLFLENERIFTAITDQWQTFSIKAMWKCFRGCGMVPKQRYRI